MFSFLLQMWTNNVDSNNNNWYRELSLFDFIIIIIYSLVHVGSVWIYWTATNGLLLRLPCVRVCVCVCLYTDEVRYARENNRQPESVAPAGSRSMTETCCLCAVHSAVLRDTIL